MSRRIISALLTILMLLTMIPFAVSAAGEECEWTVDGGDTQTGTFTAAIAAANQAETGTVFSIRLLTNVSLSQTSAIATSGAVILDLNNRTISAKSMPIRITRGKLDVIGTGTIFETVDDQYAPIVIKGATTSTATDYTVVNIGSGVTLGGWSGLFIDKYNNIYNTAYGVKVNFNGIIVTPALSEHTTAGHGIYVNGLIQHTSNCPQITIGSSASITSKGSVIYAAGYADWTINGGSFSGESGIELKAGKMTINGGTFSATGMIVHLPNGNGASTSGHALAIVENKGYAGSIDLTINDGVFNKDIAIIDDDTDSTNNNGKIAISGGTFVNDPSGWVTAGNYAKFADGKYTVGKNEIVETPVIVAPSTPSIQMPAGGDNSMAEVANALTDSTTKISNINETLNNVAEDAAPTQAEIATAITNNAPEALKTALTDNPESVKVVLKPVFEMEVVDATSQPVSGDAGSETEITSLTLNITPKVQAMATIAETASQVDPATNAVAVGTAKTIVVTEPVTISFKLPQNFVISEDGLRIKHTKDNGQIYYYDATISETTGSKIATFTVTNGFSLFTTATPRPNVTAMLKLNNGTISEYVISETGVGHPLPADTKNGSTFSGWSFEGISGVYPTLTDELMDALVAKSAALDVPYI